MSTNLCMYRCCHVTCATQLEHLPQVLPLILVVRCSSWSALIFGSLPYIICYAAAGHKLQWYVQQCSNGHLTQLHPTPFNLQTRTGRMHALLASVHCFKAVLSMWKELPQSLALPLFKPLTRAHGTSVEAKEVCGVCHAHLKSWRQHLVYCCSNMPDVTVIIMSYVCPCRRVW